MPTISTYRDQGGECYQSDSRYAQSDAARATAAGLLGHIAVHQQNVVGAGELLHIYTQPKPNHE